MCLITTSLIILLIVFFPTFKAFDHERILVWASYINCSCSFCLRGISVILLNSIRSRLWPTLLGNLLETLTVNPLAIHATSRCQIRQIVLSLTEYNAATSIIEPFLIFHHQFVSKEIQKLLAFVDWLGFLLFYHERRNFKCKIHDWFKRLIKILK